MKAIVLNGDVLPGKGPQDVRPRVASLFKLDPAAFEAKVLARCPLSIRETQDEAEVSRLGAAVSGCGAVAEVLDSDGAKWTSNAMGECVDPCPLPIFGSKTAAGR